MCTLYSNVLAALLSRGRVIVILLGGESIISLGSFLSLKVWQKNYKCDHLIPCQVARGQTMEGYTGAVYYGSLVFEKNISEFL